MSSNKKNKLYPDIGFTVDAGLINRLGIELVGRAETAVSELIKNAYDADAQEVTLNFKDSESIGGTLVLEDNGHGMTYSQLIKGFMRIASAEKITSPFSPKFKRQRAGRKGIGRFATQRLGQKLTIITKAKNNPSLKLVVNWEKYQEEVDIEKILNPIIEVDDFQNKISGTKIIIEGLREAWTQASIKRVFRYISNLIQPSYLLKNGKQKNNSTKKENIFKVDLYQTIGSSKITIADVDKMIFDHAIGEITGSVIDGKLECYLKSNRFGIEDNIKLNKDFPLLKNIYFKVYYYIYERIYYSIPKMEFNQLEKFSKTNSGIKFYRNGFRVLPYGELGNDWLNIDKASGLKTSDNKYVPFNNNNFFGFVGVSDKEGERFEETSSREGLIENEAFYQLKEFIFLCLKASATRINSQRPKKKKKRRSKRDPNDKKTTTEKLRDKIDEKKTNDNTNSDEPNNNKDEILLLEQAIEELEEIEMLRVLAGIGLTIGEFTHEIHQFFPIFKGGIGQLSDEIKNKSSIKTLQVLKDSFSRFESYADYIDATIRSNSNREKLPIDLRATVADFIEVIQNNAQRGMINIEKEFYGYDLMTRPMHPSEWNSILYNLFTNSKKAISRNSPDHGQIKIVVGKENKLLYLEFMDNGDGIPNENKDKIFDPFFTTSTPSLYNASKSDSVLGMGLGLKIVKDIIDSYRGSIDLVEPEAGFNTCFRIEIKLATQKEIDEYA